MLRCCSLEITGNLQSTLFNCVFSVRILAFSTVLTTPAHSPFWGFQEISKSHTSTSPLEFSIFFQFSEDDHYGHLPFKLRVHHIIHHPNQDTFEDKRGAFNNHSKARVVNRLCPKQTMTYVLIQSLNSLSVKYFLPSPKSRAFLYSCSA